MNPGKPRTKYDKQELVREPRDGGEVKSRHFTALVISYFHLFPARTYVHSHWRSPCIVLLVQPLLIYHIHPASPQAACHLIRHAMQYSKSKGIARPPCHAKPERIQLHYPMPCHVYASKMQISVPPYQTIPRPARTSFRLE